MSGYDGWNPPASGGIQNRSCLTFRPSRDTTADKISWRSSVVLTEGGRRLTPYSGLRGARPDRRNMGEAMRKMTQWSARPSFCAAIVLTVTAMILVTPVLAGDSRDGSDGRPASMIVLEERIAAGDLKYRDSRTGEVVVATRERIDALRSNLERHFGQPPVYNEKVSANGAVVSVIDDAIRDVHLMRINLDGTRTTACLRDLDAAVAFLVGLDIVENETADNRPVAATR